MGFSFNRASQGGGKVFREPHAISGGQGGTMDAFVGVGSLMTAPTNYPYYLTIAIDSYGDLYNPPYSSYTDVGSNTDGTVSISIPSSRWMDFVVLGRTSGINHNGNGASMRLDSIQFNGSAQSIPSRLMADYFMPFITAFDVYGYGNTITATFYNPYNYTCRVCIAPASPRNIRVDASGNIINPSYSGYSVFRNFGDSL